MKKGSQSQRLHDDDAFDIEADPKEYKTSWYVEEAEHVRPTVKWSIRPDEEHLIPLWIEFDRTGKRVLALTTCNQVVVYDANDGTVIYSEKYTSIVNFALLKGEKLYLGLERHEFRLVDISTREILAESSYSDDRYRYFREGWILPDNKFALMTCDMYVVWDPETNTFSNKFQSDDDCHFAPDGSFLLVMEDDSHVLRMRRLRDIHGGKVASDGEIDAEEGDENENDDVGHSNDSLDENETVYETSEGILYFAFLDEQTYGVADCYGISQQTMDGSDLNHFNHAHFMSPTSFKVSADKKKLASFSYFDDRAVLWHLSELSTQLKRIDYVFNAPKQTKVKLDGENEEFWDVSHDGSYLIVYSALQKEIRMLDLYPTERSKLLLLARPNRLPATILQIIKAMMI